MQPFIARRITTFALVVIVGRSIQLHDQAMLETKEVGNVWTDGNLTSEFQSVDARSAQETPKHRLGVGHVAAQLPRLIPLLF